MGFLLSLLFTDCDFSPQMIAQLMGFAVSFVSTVFCGHLGRTELAGVSLAIAVSTCF